MASLAEFTIFSALPSELRLKIWESVPQPERVIGQLPCSKCWKFAQARGIGAVVRTDCARHLDHPDWRLRWVGNNQGEAIFPPLHACRESRAAWLPRYFAPPRYLDLPKDNMRHNDDGESPVIYKLRFDIPYVSYETDVFAVFDTGMSILGFDVDPLLGFDRRRIQKLAISENAWSTVEAIATIKPQSLPALRSLSILVSGPDPDIDGSAVSGWQEMHAVDIQNVDCDLRVISEQLVIEHPLFSKSRLNHVIYQPDPNLRPLVNYYAWFRAWLWHASRWDDHKNREAARIPWWDFLSYVDDEEYDICPLEEDWCSSSHTKEEMLNWNSPFAVDFLLLAEKRCMAELTSSSALEIHPANSYEWFYHFKEKRIATFNARMAMQ